MIHCKEVSFVILNYNGMEFLETCLNSVQKAIEWERVDHEVIVVDNGSTDGSVAFIKEVFPFVTIVSLPENQFVTAYNEGFSASTKDICIFLNNDMIVEKDFLPPLLIHFKDGSVFSVGPMILQWGGQPKHSGVGKSEGSFSFGYFRARGITYKEMQEKGFLERPSYSLHIGAGAYDRKKYMEIGGLDSLFQPCYWEDVDLSFRAWRRGWQVIFEPKSVIHHKHQGTTSKLFTRNKLRRIMGKNRHLLIWKNGLEGWGTYFLFLPLRLFVPLLKGDGGPLCAFMDAFRDRRVAWDRRKKEDGMAQVSHSEIWARSRRNQITP